MMNLKLITIGLASLMFVYSCGDPADPTEKAEVKSVNSKTNVKKEQERLVKIRAKETQEITDSIKLGMALQNALEIANANINKDAYYDQYEVKYDSSSVYADVSLKHHFSATTTHLLIRRTGLNYIYIDIYTRNNNLFEKVLSHKEWTMTYVNDTIQDINGDGLADFVVNWYGSNGCCLKAFSNVYLLRRDNKTFSSDFEFINPTFSPREKIIRGVCYGHPGETEVYKYRWNNETVDTLEYISYEVDTEGVKTGKIIVSTAHPSRTKSKTWKILNSVPSEYSNIQGFGWFTGEEYN